MKTNAGKSQMETPPTRRKKNPGPNDDEKPRTDTMKTNAGKSQMETPPNQTKKNPGPNDDEKPLNGHYENKRRKSQMKALQNQMKIPARMMTKNLHLPDESKS